MVYENKFIINQLKSFLKNIFNTYSNSSSLTLNTNDLTIKNNLLDISDLNEPLKSLFQIILSTAKNCESKYADGYYLFLYKLYNKLSSTNLNIQEYIDKNVLSFFDIKSILNKENNINNFLKEAIEYSILNMNRNSRIGIEKSINNNYIIKFSDGFKFECKNENLIYKNKILYNPIIIIIDGYIETVSEINSLLENASKNKDTILLLCRGANNDVISTINLNLKRDTLNVNLCILPFNENTLNILKDIAICTNSESDMLSIDKGDIIRSINNYKKFKKINSVIFENNSITFINDNINTSSINLHIKYLEEKCQEYISGDNIPLLEIYLNRLLSLNSRQSTIMIPESNNQDLEIKICNNIIRKISEITKFGAIKIDDTFYSSKCDSYTDESIEFILNYINNISYILT